MLCHCLLLPFHGVSPPSLVVSLPFPLPTNADRPQQYADPVLRINQEIELTTDKSCYATGNAGKHPPFCHESQHLNGALLICSRLIASCGVCFRI